MTNFEKYELILIELGNGLTHREIIAKVRCSFSLIPKAVAWDLEGKPIVIRKVTKKKVAKESSKKKVAKESSKKDIKINFDKFFNSRLLSYFAKVLDIEGYWDLTKKQLKILIIDKISKI